MAKFKNSNLQFKDNKKIVFGDSEDVNLYFDGLELKLDTTVSGIPITFNFGSFTISGSGDIYCHDLFTAASGIYLGDSHLSYDGESLEVSSSVKTQGNLLGNYNTDSHEPTGFVERLGSLGFPIPPISSISFDDSTRTFTISGSEFLYYDQGKRYKVKGSESVQISDTEGLWHIYYDGPTLTATHQSGTTYDTAVKPYVALVYWDADNNKALYFGEERHGITMDGTTQYYLGNTEGLGYNSGFNINASFSGTGSADADAQIEIEPGIIHDADIRITVTTSGAFAPGSEVPYWLGQNISLPAEIPVYYVIGDGNSTIRKNTADAFPVYDVVGTGRIGYNKIEGVTYSIEEVSDGYFAISWILATNNIIEPIVAILGQGDYSTLAEAEAVIYGEDIKVPGWPMKSKLLYKLIYQTDSSYANSVKTRQVLSVDYRHMELGLQVGTPIDNHRALKGLDYDSSGHTGFLAQDGSVSLIGDWDFGSQTISGTGDIYCHDLFTAASGIYLGDSHLSYDGENLEVSSNFKTQGNLLGNYNDDTQEPTGFILELGGAYSSPEPTSFISFDDSSRTFTISGAEFLYYDQGKRYKVKGSESVQIDDVTGFWGIYFDGPDLVAYPGGGSPTALSNKVSVALFWWCSDAGKALYILDQRHGIKMDGATQHYIDHTQGITLDLWAGFNLYRELDDVGPYVDLITFSGTGDSDSDAQIGLAGGFIHNSDMRILITTSGDARLGVENPPYSYTQDLGLPAEIPIYYSEGAAGSVVFKKREATTFPFIDSVGTGRIGYITVSGSAYSVEEVPDNHYVIYWLILQPDTLTPVSCVPDTKTYSNLNDAERVSPFNGSGSMGVTGHFGIMKTLHKLIFQTSDSFTNSVKANLVSSTDYRLIDYAYARTPTPHKSWSYLDYASSGHTGFMSLDTDQTAGGEKTFTNTIHHADDILPTVSGTSSIGGEELPYTQIYLADQATSDTYSITMVSGTLVATMV